MSEKPAKTEYSSHDRAFKRFDDPSTSNYYPQEFTGNNSRTVRDRANIDRAMSYFKKGDHILDLPCGSGRLTAMLLDRGLEITAADSSQNMVDRAQAFILEKFPQAAGSTFCVQDITGTSFENKQFDGIICYRLFHHFHEPSLRIRSLKELARISKGEIVVSMHTSNALGYLGARLKKLLKGGGKLSRSYPPLAVFEQEVASAGLRVVEKLPRQKGISPLWVYVLKAE